MPVSQIKNEIGFSKEAVYKNIDKALALGPIEALKDRPGKGARPRLSVMKLKPGWFLWLVNPLSNKITHKHISSGNTSGTYRGINSKDL